MPQCSSARSLQLHLFFSGTGCDSGPWLHFLSVTIPFQFQAAVPSFFLLPHQSLKSISSWHLRGKGEASPFALNRDKGPEPLTLHMFALCLVRRLLATFPWLGPKTGLSVCPCHPVIPGIDFPLRRTPERVSDWQPPLSAWAAAQAVGHICGHDTPHLPWSYGEPLGSGGPQSQKSGQPTHSSGVASACTHQPRGIVGLWSALLSLPACHATCSL